MVQRQVGVHLFELAVLLFEFLYPPELLTAHSGILRTPLVESGRTDPVLTGYIGNGLDSSLSIIDHTLVEKPDYDNKEKLSKQIEEESLRFINEIRSVLEQ